MRFIIGALIMTAAFTAARGAAAGGADSSGLKPLHAVPFTAVSVEDRFWSARIRLNREKVLPHNFKFCQSTGRIDNFAKAAGLMPGKHEGAYFNDSDVYKVLEGAAYTLAHGRDAAIEQTVDDIAAKIAAAQQPDGYLNTYFTLVRPQDRWKDDTYHETYCAGHLIEAAIAYFQATGKRNLLDVAIKLADHMTSIFGPGKQHCAPQHQEIELALIKLHRLTGEKRYLELAAFFIEERGHAETHKLWGEYAQDLAPVRQQREIVGHAVRAMYFYCGVADLAAITGDPALIQTMDHIWEDVTRRKMYITGGIGPSASNEGFTVPYDLPNDTAYCETCASIGMALWNHRLCLLHADARYADVVERVMYNGILSGVSLEGTKFFYVNPLASRGRHHRQEWFGCACCPTNVVRILPTIGGYVYAHDDQAIHVNHYVGGTGKITIGGKVITLIQSTDYPWNGRVRIEVQPPTPAAFTLALRIPGWCQGASVRINGRRIDALQIANGYVRLQRQWNGGDAVELDLPMPVRRVYAHPAVAANRGRVALQRGPIVYCVEGADNDGRARELVLPPESPLSFEHRPELLGGVTVVKGRAVALARSDADSSLYRSAPAVRSQPVDLIAIPYYAWDNRRPGPMVVWLAEDASRAEPTPLMTIASQARCSASHCAPEDTLEALNDQVDPAGSADKAIPRFSWQPHRGSSEWVQYDFAWPQKIVAVEVYFFHDERARGGTRLPALWRLFYREGDQWKPIPGEYPTRADCFNRVEFSPITTTGLRIEAQLQPGFSAGILEWRVVPGSP